MNFAKGSKPKRHVLSVLAIGAILGLGSSLVASPAFAVDDRRGTAVCDPGQKARVNSTTTTAGKPAGVAFAVGHYLSTTVSWNTHGYHLSVHPVVGGSYTVSTNGTITGYGSSCGY